MPVFERAVYKNHETYNTTHVLNGVQRTVDSEFVVAVGIVRFLVLETNELSGNSIQR